MIEQLEEKVGFLEHTLNRFIIHQDKALYRLERTVESLSQEMKEFKDEMKEFKDEMKEFKDEMKEFKDEMKEFKDESIANRKEMNKKWGDLSNKLGSFAEDIAAPNIPRIAKQYFGAKEILKYMPNIRVKHPEKKDTIHEFDAVVETDTTIFLLETKFTVRETYIDQIPAIIKNYKECFPEYSKHDLVTIFGSMSIHESTIKKLTKMGIYAMAMGDDNMDLINFEELQKLKK